MAGLGGCRDVIDGLIISVQNICVSCRNDDNIIGSSVLDILPDYLYLDLHCVGCTGQTSVYKGEGLIDIVENSF